MKALIVIVVALLIALAATACGGGGDSYTQVDGTTITVPQPLEPDAGNPASEPVEVPGESPVTQTPQGDALCDKSRRVGCDDHPGQHRGQ